MQVQKRTLYIMLICTLSLWYNGSALAIESEMEDARGIRDASASGKRKEDQPSSSLGMRSDFYPTSAPGIGPVRVDDMLLLPST